MSKQFYIQHPVTKKKIVVSRDAYHAIQQTMELGQKQQTEVQESVQKVSKLVCKKTYISETANVKIAVNFKENGEVNIFSKKIQLMNSLASLDEELKQTILNAMNEYQIALNKALATKNNDLQSKAKEVVTTKAEQAA